MILSNTSLPTVFEITDVDIPDYIDEPFLSSLDYKTHYEYEGNIRESAFLTDKLEQEISKILAELGEKFREKLIELTEKDFLHWWPSDIFKCFNFNLDSKLVSAGIFRDSAKFNMGMHVDNGLSLGTSIINLIDQEANTVYYDDDTGETIAYSGPTERGTGIVHLNHPGLWHSGVNNADKERYILMTYYAVNNITCGQNL